MLTNTIYAACPSRYVCNLLDASFVLRLICMCSVQVISILLTLDCAGRGGGFEYKWNSLVVETKAVGSYDHAEVFQADA